MFAVFVVAYGLACTPIAGPTGLGDLENWQYAVKILLGAIGAYAILAPLVTAHDATFGFLTSPVMTTLGKWSYGIFIWHVAVLTVVFGLFGITAFNGHFAGVWVLTAVISIGVAAASYVFVEEPCRQALLRWEKRRSERDAGAA